MCEGTSTINSNEDNNEVGETKETSPKEPRLPILDRWPEDPSASGNPWDCVIRQWSNWTFSYMGVVLSKGARQKNEADVHLSENDLFVVPETLKSLNLVREFDICEASKPEGMDATGFLLRTLWKIAAPIYIPAGLCQLVVVVCGTALPLLVMQLLRVIESNPGQSINREGLPYAISIFSVSIINGFANHRHRHLAMKTGVALRAAVVNILYEHVLRLSPQGKAGLTSGEVTNLISVDTQKLYEVTQEGHLIWALPLSVFLVSFFLYRTLGPSTLVGIAVLMGFVPLIQQVTSKMLTVRGKRVVYADQRVEIVSNMLQGIKVTKLNNYEKNYHTRVTETRDAELKYLSREMAIWATTLLMTVTSPVLATAACFSTYVLIDEGSNVLTASDTFGVLLLFSALRFPINFAGRLVGKAAQALSATRRIALFLERPLRHDDETTEETATTELTPNSINDEKNTQDTSKKEETDEIPLKLSRASFRVGDVLEEEDFEKEGSSNGFTVSEFNFSLSKGELLAVCGPVGSGKSTLLNGILGEAQAMGPTEVTMHGQLSYVPQTPFILNLSVRDNILFGQPFDQEWYDKVLDACCLRPDLEQLGEAGDMTEIGERGVTLSGGQKQRISLARAAYARSSLIILDDPFSALDSGTGKVVFERLIATPDALLRDSAVLLVTHASHFITNRAVDKILLIVDGNNRFIGAWDELAGFIPSDENTRRAVDHIKSAVREDTEESDEEEDAGEEKGQNETGKSKKKGRLIQAETREHGLSSMKTWLLWFKRAGGLSFILLQLIFMTIDRASYVAVELFLAKWTSAADGPITILGIEFPAQTDGFSAQAQYLKVYVSIILISTFATFVRSEWAVTGGGRATRNVFYSMLSSVLRAPINYFETVPMGRILNRFTYDTDVNDVNLTQVMSMFMISCSWYVAGVIIQCTILPWSALVVFPVSAMYWILMLHYRLSGPDLQRIDALSRSPLQSMVNEGLEGSTSIRVFRQERNFVNKFRDNADTNSSALLNFVSAQRWLGVRMELLGSIVVLVSSVLVVCLNDELNLEPGLVGLLIMWSSNFTITLNFLVDTFSETEAAITAIERVDAMADLPGEKAMESDDAHRPSSSWPEQGLLEFDNVSLRYREGLPLALDKLSFKIPAGKTCGVVGRTGAGKSSITVALFRLVEIESGRVLLDGTDLGEIGLSDVRGRGMAIIPQDPFLAGASLRECLDPFGQHGDDEIRDALKSVRLASTSSSNDKSLLSTKLEEGGSNYSVGERQLLNLARALLSQPKLLVLDEATASIDGETDAFIQKMLRTRFPDTTLVTIAHRLNTIMDYDMTLVMDAGHAVEFGSPADLLDIKGGVFSELVDATGSESSKALREMAKQAASARHE
jgi:ABC-type multidrug transport system fused ATPase/permease subunit